MASRVNSIRTKPSLLTCMKMPISTRVKSLICTRMEMPNSTRMETPVSESMEPGIFEHAESPLFTRMESSVPTFGSTAVFTRMKFGVPNYGESTVFTRAKFPVSLFSRLHIYGPFETRNGHKSDQSVTLMWSPEMCSCACNCTCTQYVGNGASRPLTHLREVARGGCTARFVGQEPSPCAVMVSATERDVPAGSGCTCTPAAPGDASPVGSETRAEGSGALGIHPERRADYGTAGGGSDGPAGNREVLCAGGCPCGSTLSLDPFECVHRAAVDEVWTASNGDGTDAAIAARGHAGGRHALLSNAMGRRASVRPSRERSGRGSRVLGAAAPNKRAASYATPACHNAEPTGSVLTWGFSKSPGQFVTGPAPVYYMRQRPTGRMRIARTASQRRRFRAFTYATGRS